MHEIFAKGQLFGVERHKGTCNGTPFGVGMFPARDGMLGHHYEDNHFLTYQNGGARGAR